MKLILILLLNFTCFPQTSNWLIGIGSGVEFDVLEGAADCADGTTDAINRASTMNASATQDSLILTITHANPDSIWDVYWMLGLEDKLGDETSHVCWDSSGVRGTSALRFAIHIDSVAETDSTPGLIRGSFYSFKSRIKGEDAVGVSSWSDWDTLNIPFADSIDIIKPNAVTNFVATGFNVIAIPKTYIVLAWDSSTSTDVNYVKIMRDSGNTYVSGDSLDNVDGAVVTYQDTLVGANETWSYQPIAVDDTGNVSISNPSDSGFVPNTATVPNPNPPVLAAVADTFFVTLTADTTGSWVSGGGTIDSLKFYESGSLLTTQIGLVYIHTGLITNTAYSYTAKVKDSNGNLSVASNTKNVTTIDSAAFSSTNHYVDKNATGDNNGTSWANAWESIAAISWGSIDPGDILYISGGTDSTVYFETLAIQANGTSANWVTVRNSYDAGHNGRVIMRGDGTGYGMRLPGISTLREYIYIKGIELRNWFIALYINGAVNVVTIDSVIIDEFYHRGVNCIGWEEQYDTGPDSITFQNCNITTFPSIDDQTDAFYVKYSSNITIQDCYFRVSNISSVNGHSDVIQGNPVEGFRVINNVFICDSAAMGIVYIAGAVNDPDDGQVDSVIIYNNYMYGGGIYLGLQNYASVFNPEHKQAYSKGPAPHFVAHNTFVSKGPCYAAIHEASNYPDGALMINNMFVQFEENTLNGDPNGGTNNYEGHLWIRNFRNGNSLVDSIRHNLMWTEWSTGKFNGKPFTGNDTTGTAFSWDDWVNVFGGTGVNGDPLFTQRPGYVADQGTLTGELQSGSPARNQGEDIQALIESMGLPWTDINGVARDSTPDIGAYEYVP